MPDAKPDSQWSTTDARLTSTAQDVLNRAAVIAAARAQQADALDVLAAMLQARGTLADKAIRALGADPPAMAKSLPARDGSPGLPLKQLLHNSMREAVVLGHYQVDSIHLLLALLYSDSPATSGPLQAAGITLYDLRRHLQTGTTADFAPGAGDRPRSDKSRPDAALRRRPLESLDGAIKVSPVFLAIVAVTAGSGALLWFGPVAGLVGPLTIVFVTAGWVASVCVHEFGHAIVAYLGGDRSVAASGYLSLNPLRYTNVLMSLVLPIVFLLLGGIGLPGGAVYINHSALRSRAWDSAVSVAGPFGTLLCGLLVASPFLIPGHDRWITATNVDFFAALAFLGFIEAIALLLNLVPVPGLDGFGILRPWLPYSIQDAANRYAMLAIVGVFIALFYIAPIRDNFFMAVEQLTSFAGINPFLIAFGQARMHQL